MLKKKSDLFETTEPSKANLGLESMSCCFNVYIKVLRFMVFNATFSNISIIS